MSQRYFTSPASKRWAPPPPLRHETIVLMDRNRHSSALESLKKIVVVETLNTVRSSTVEDGSRLNTGVVQ